MPILIPTVTIGGATYTFGSAQDSTYGLFQFFAGVLNPLIGNGTLVNTTYQDGASTPGGTNLLTINSNTRAEAQPSIQLGTGYSAVLVNTDLLYGAAGTTRVSLQGGAAGETVLSGSSGMSYTNVTPPGLNATDYIAAAGGNNVIVLGPLSPVGPGYVSGNYFVATGDGDDTIAISAGNATIEAGGGNNRITLGSSLGPTSGLVISNGYDAIFGGSLASDTERVAIGTGQTTINPIGASFIVSDGSANALSVFRGSGSDTVQIGGLGGGTVQGGTAGNNLLVGGVGGTASARIVLQGGGSGDLLAAVGGGAVTLLGATGNEVLNAGLSVSRGNLLQAGQGNETLVAGAGSDTLSAYGAGSTAVMLSGSGAGTTFQFVRGLGGGQDIIGGFKATDTLAFYGYGANPLAAAQQVGGSTVLALSDGTQITLGGVASVSAGQVRAV